MPAGLTLYLRYATAPPGEFAEFPLLSIEQTPQRCSFDVPKASAGLVLVEAARTSQRLLQAGIYQQAGPGGDEVKILMAGRVHSHWVDGDTATIVLTLFGPMKNLAG